MNKASWYRLKKETTSAVCFSLVFYFSFLIGHSSGLFNNNQTPVTCETDLAHWGLADPSDVGFISVGILHKKGGDELVVYDIRKKRPVIKEPPKPESRIPPFQGDVFLLDDFRQGNVNRLGGYFNGFSKAPSLSSITIDKASGGLPSLCYFYEQTSPGFAGFWIHLFDFKVPPTERAFLDSTPFTYLTFAIRGEEGNERLTLQVADYSWENREDSLEVGDLARFLPKGKIEKNWQRAWIPLENFPDGISRKELASLVFLAWEGRGRVYIQDIAFTTKKDAQIPPPQQKRAFKPSPHRAMWLWETKALLGNDLEQDQLVDFCRKNGMTEIFLQLPYEVEEKDEGRKIIWDTSKAKVLLSKLHGAAIKVYALDGDPRYAFREWHDHVVATIQSVIQFNKSVQPDERFDGLRFDNEPYLLPHFAGVQKESILRQYLDMLRISKKIAGSANLEFGVDIPFWFDQKNEFFEPITELEGRPLTEHVIDIVDNIGIMDYRTEAYGADGIIAHALGELQYASKVGKKIFIGLETTDLPDETILEFGQGKGASRILLEKLEGTKILLRWIPEGPAENIENGVFLYQKNETFVPAGKLTFADKSMKDLTEVMEKAESEFNQFPGFYGFVIHSYKSLRVLWQKQEGNRR
ncbi:MAG: hypothetical protein OEW23_07060 [Candidatus Aminicenantes bacterium]|nr:hypothetical protein [Candidatus Aminicenantes bacterium]